MSEKELNWLYQNACDVLDTAREVSTDANVTIEQALKAMEITALNGVINSLDRIE